jgi:DNA repair protein RecO (recombination protein O)
MPTAIVLTTTKYSDTGSIVHLYTPDQGRVQCVVYGNKLKGVLRPLSIIEYSSSRRNNAPLQMQTLSSASLVYTPTLLSYDVLRQCVAMFIAELLTYTLRHPMSDQPLFDWLCNCINILDKEEDISNLHIEFLLDYAVYLGIGIDEEEHPDWYSQPTSRIERQERLRELIAYFQEHIDDLPTIKSLDVLIEVFN